MNDYWPGVDGAGGRGRGRGRRGSREELRWVSGVSRGGGLTRRWGRREGGAFLAMRSWAYMLAAVDSWSLATSPPYYLLPPS